MINRPAESALTVPFALLRGGTSKGVFVLRDMLPPEGFARDELIRDLLGSPDPNQLDGLGGAQMTTSKLVAVGRSERPNTDLDYLFAQVDVATTVVDYGGNCGNLTSAVVPYALHRGLVEASPPRATFRLWNENTGRRIEATLPVGEGGQPVVSGDYRVPGVIRPGARIDCAWLSPTGSMLGRALPTGRTHDRVDSPRFGSVTVSLVDAATPVALVDADELGLHGELDPAAVNADTGLLAALEHLRGLCAVRLGLCEPAATAAEVSPNVPKLGIVRAGDAVGVDAHLDVRMVVMGRMMETYAATGLIATAVAARLPGTVAARLVGDDVEPVLLHHPAGTVDLSVSWHGSGGPKLDADDAGVAAVTMGRTARLLAYGEAVIPRDCQSCAR